MKNFRGVFTKFRSSSDFWDLRIYFPPASAHGPMGFIKRRPLIQRSASKIYHREGVSRLLILDVHHRSDSWRGWLRPGAARAHVHSGPSRPSAAARRSSGFLEVRWSVSDKVCSYEITTMRGTRLG
jgi:hypothetical protein